MYILGAESSVPAYVTADGLEPPRLFCSAITPPMFLSRRNTECIVHKLQNNPQALCYVEIKISFEH